MVAKTCTHSKDENQLLLAPPGVKHLVEGSDEGKNGELREMNLMKSSVC
jgi:hypothetical protein